VLEAVMAGVVIAIFLGGIVVAALVVIAVSVHREDRHFTLVGDAPDLLSRSTRRLNGVGRRGLAADFPRPVRELVH
jgi:hypothetical protein